MWFLRMLAFAMTGIAFAIVQLGIISSLPFPVSRFPLFAVILALVVVNRVRLTWYWLLVCTAFSLDVYTGSAFGIHLIALALCAFIGTRISTDLVTHRSFAGCLVISFIVGFAWSCSIDVGMVFSQYEWFGGGLSGILRIIGSGFIEALVVAVISGIVYVLTPKWFVQRSPTLLHHASL